MYNVGKIAVVLILFIATATNVHVHNGEEEQGMGFAWDWMLLIFFICLLLIAWVVKLKHRTYIKSLNGLIYLLILIVVISAILTFYPDKKESMVIQHYHGMSYAPDGDQLIVATHDGIRMYRDEDWFVGQGDRHDYMGFSGVNNGFYSSGHPAVDSTLEDPIGIVKGSYDNGELERITLYGEMDFHIMDAGYESHTIYVMNPFPNQQMNQSGLMYSLDQGQTWVASNLSGLTSDVQSLTVHPTDERIVAVATREGLYISSNYGNDFSPLLKEQVTAIEFASNGTLLAGIYTREGPELVQFDDQMNEVFRMSLPLQKQDAVQYLAQHPEQTDHLVIATYNMNMYKTTDRGSSWKQILDQGTAEYLHD
ncbi:F510_1955 family glycosylhydrolase [Marinicrinis sediminis]|uniref:F510_1955 family glycosylhydrolase n=1 Tax=Marinicrinis sediminis TaxID=1652465 RepID=A0ABW5REU2_9BACL